ncbi:hypothetical protein [Clostridium coskatii]|uniref:Uncharacterized protein n=1 Tax=Clostridium coskatii TaxID=1705578 RepID=A0A166TQ02_9CLOT|nr:hypothetical protein [Clostridium coskatii]OAA93954.1 hypothetical protein WX73_03864 [Clostridium coskatii]OBR95283.1 hypothetical protein CLCOS_16070 [Clostridium coskatii]
MNQNENMLHKFIKNYTENKQNRVQDLGTKKEKLEIQLKKEEEKLDKLSAIKEKLIAKEKSYDEVYSYLLQILKSRGILFDIPKSAVEIEEWDNLYIKKEHGAYSLIDKNQQAVYSIDKKYYDSIEHIVTNYKYSAVVVRKDAYFLKVQIRIL